MQSACGRRGGDFTKTSADTTAIEEGETQGLAYWPFLPLRGGATAWALVWLALGAGVVEGFQSRSRCPGVYWEQGGYLPFLNRLASYV